MSDRQSTIFGASAVMHIFVFMFAFVATQTQGEELPDGWLVTTTDHIRIVFRADDIHSANELASFADEVYDIVSGYLGASTKSRVLCVLRSDTDIANGSYHPLPPHINLITSSPTGPLMGSTTESWLRVVFAHELEHYLQMQAADGFTGVLSAIFGPSVASFIGGFTPGWMVEGPAIMAETAATSGGRGRNGFFDLPARAMILQGSLFSLEQAAHESYAPPSGRIYLAGYLLMDYIERTYGEGTFRKILGRFAGFPFFGPWQAIRSVTGASASGIYADMKEALATEYFADSTGNTTDLSAAHRGTRISPDGTGNWYLPVVTDRGLYVYRTLPDKRRAVVRLDPMTGTESVVLEARLTDGYSFSADAEGSLLAFTTPMSLLEFDGVKTVSELYLFALESGELRRLTRFGHLRHPALSPDGSRLVAVRQERSFAALVEIDIDTGNQRVLYRAVGTNIYTPTFSSDGSSIFFVINDRGAQDIVSISSDIEAVALSDAHTGGVNADSAVRHTDSPGIGEYCPRESAGMLLFGVDGTSALEVDGIDLTTGKRYRVAADPIGAFAGVRDGDSVIYASYSTGGYSVHRAPYSPEPFAPEPLTSGEIGPGPTVASPEDRIAPTASVPGYVPIASSIDTKSPVTAGSGISAYVDLPRPAYWMPLPIVMDPFSGTVTGFGIGAVVYARSPVYEHELYLEASVRPDVYQPGLEFEAVFYPGIHAITLSVAHGYLPKGDIWSQTSEISIKHTFPVMIRDLYPGYRSVSLGWYARYRISQYDFDPFTPFAGAFPPVYSLTLSALSGITLSRRGTSRHSTAPSAFSAGVRLDGNIVSPDPDYPSFSGELSVLGNLPIGTSNHVVSISARTGVRSSAYNLQVGLPKGGFPVSVHAGMTDVLASLTWYMPILPLDIPIPFGFHLGGIYANLFSEAYASVIPTPTIDPHVYFGGEISVELGRTVHIPLILGIETRISTIDPGSFRFADDIRFYFDAGNLTGTIIGNRSHASEAL